jgi:TetR/AcrR family transcriptional repressor of lmrAB and yxaGH operons
MVETTTLLLRRQGYNGTGLNQIIEESRAPKGSLYHFFPGGKDSLVGEAVREGAREVERQMREALSQARSVAEGLAFIVRGIIEDLRASNFEAGCPISTVALETAATSGPIRSACSEAFRSIQSTIEEALRSEGRSEAEAHALANLIICAYEGALLLSRTHHDTAPLEEMARTLRRLFESPPPRVVP